MKNRKNYATRMLIATKKLVLTGDCQFLLQIWYNKKSPWGLSLIYPKPNLNYYHIYADKNNPLDRYTVFEFANGWW